MKRIYAFILAALLIAATLAGCTNTTTPSPSAAGTPAATATIKPTTSPLLPTLSPAIPSPTTTIIPSIIPTANVSPKTT